MVEEYINKKNLLADIRRAASRSSLGETTEPYLDWKEVVSFIADAPVEDVAPVRRGKWIDIPDYGGSGWQIAGKSVQPKQCSVCGDVYSKAYNYCPWCGACMKGE